MDAFLLVEPYITGIISILGIFFIEAFVVASFKLYINQFLSPKTYHIMITLISGLIMTFFFYLFYDDVSKRRLLLDIRQFENDYYFNSYYFSKS